MAYLSAAVSLESFDFYCSEELKCKMNFAVYLPPQAEDPEAKLPVLYWLSGLTCSERNFVEKAGGQRLAAEKGFVVVCPDTSPSNFALADNF